MCCHRNQAWYAFFGLKADYRGIIPYHSCSWNGSQKEKEGGVDAGIKSYS